MVNKLIIPTSFSRKKRAQSLLICVQIPSCLKHFRTGSRKAQRTSVTHTVISSYKAFTAIMSTGKLFFAMVCSLCQLLCYWFFCSHNVLFSYLFHLLFCICSSIFNEEGHLTLFPKADADTYINGVLITAPSPVRILWNLHFWSCVLVEIIINSRKGKSVFAFQVLLFMQYIDKYT